MSNFLNKVSTLDYQEQITIGFNGNYIRVMVAQGEVKITLDGGSFYMEQGDSIKAEPFTSILVENKHTGQNQVSLFLSAGSEFRRDTKLTGQVTMIPKLGEGINYQTLELNGIEKQVLDYDIGRLSVRLHNLSDEPIKIGQSDVSQTFYELQADEILTLAKAPILAVWVIGTGRLSVVCEYKEQQAVIEAEPLADENGVLTDDNDNTLDTY